MHNTFSTERMLSALVSSQEENPAECDWISTTSRWNVVKSFTINDTNDLVCIAIANGVLHSFPTSEPMRNASPVNMDMYNFAINLESALFCDSTSIREYTQGAVRITHALINNGECLRRGVSNPSELISMPFDKLMIGTVTEQIQHQMDAHEHRFKEMLQERFEELDNTDNSDGLLQCGRCKSTNVIWEQRQTRSADEGMTINAVCVKCSNKWRMT